MKSKLFIFCSECGSFEREVKTKKDMYKFCPMCGEKMRGIKIPEKKYFKCKEEIKSVGLGMWFGIETMFKD